MKVAHRIIGLATLAIAQIAFSQSQPQTQTPELSIGENTKLSAGGLFTFGYSGDYGDVISSNTD